MVRSIVSVTCKSGWQSKSEVIIRFGSKRTKLDVLARHASEFMYVRSGPICSADSTLIRSARQLDRCVQCLVA